MSDLRLVLLCLKGKVTYHGQVDSDIVQPNENENPRPKTKDDLTEDALKQYETDIEAMNLILISIPNDIYNSVDACQIAQKCGLGSSRSSHAYYVTHPPSMVDYDDEYQGEKFQNDSEDPLTSAMILLARAIIQRFSNPTNNRLRSSSNTRNQAVMQADRVNIQRKNVGNDGRIVRRSYNVQEETAEGTNVQKETENVQRNLRTYSSGNVSNVQCYNCNEKGHYARNCPNPRV
ncbi:gag-pol polyprotein [Tanacetum coccineum]